MLLEFELDVGAFELADGVVIAERFAPDAVRRGEGGGRGMEGTSGMDDEDMLVLGYWPDLRGGRWRVYIAYITITSTLGADVLWWLHLTTMATTPRFPSEILGLIVDNLTPEALAESHTVEYGITHRPWTAPSAMRYMADI